jgi:hypothetical protein
MRGERTFNLHQADQLRTDIANPESGLEIIMAQLARQPTRGDLAKTACWASCSVPPSSQP